MYPCPKPEDSHDREFLPDIDRGAGVPDGLVPREHPPPGSPSTTPPPTDAAPRQLHRLGLGSGGVRPLGTLRRPCPPRRPGDRVSELLPGPGLALASARRRPLERQGSG